jgi:branched-chain amino acid transport system ATP-binding protein
MPAMLEIGDLVAAYGPIRALKGVSLQVGTGEIVCVIGPNGAGKTTLMRSILGMLAPLSGSIRLEGRAIAGSDPEHIVAAGVSLVPEGRRIFAPLSVADNLTLGAYHRLRKRDASVGEDRAMVLDMFPRLRERLDQPAGTLSGGEQQMLAIARALMARPRLLLLDEPSMGLAPKIVAEIFATIRALHARGMTIFLAEQNARMALAVADRAYVLESGLVTTTGPAAMLARDDAVRAAYLGG